MRQVIRDVPRAPDNDQESQSSGQDHTHISISDEPKNVRINQSVQTSTHTVVQAALTKDYSVMHVSAVYLHVMHVRSLSVSQSATKSAPDEEEPCKQDVQNRCKKSQQQAHTKTSDVSEVASQIIPC